MVRSIILACLLVAASWPASASAQDPDGEFSVQRFTPAPGAHNYLAIDGGQVTGHLAPSLGLTLDYANGPFVIVTCPDEETCDLDKTETEIVKHLFMAHVHGAVTLVDRVQLGLVLPVGISAGEQLELGGRRRVGGDTGGGLGDPELSVKAGLFDQGAEGLDLAASAFITFPLGQATAEEQYIGDDTVTAGGQAILGYVVQDFHFAVNAGGVWRKEQTFLSTSSGPALTYGLGVGYDVTEDITLLGELDGSSSFSSQVDENPLEGRLGGRLRAGDFTFSLGVGTGIIAGMGTPLVRVLGGAAWQPRKTDADRDGVEDANDQCPNDPEDLDGFEDDDGCPDPDNDGDGLPDDEDPCPDEAEDVDGFEDEDGCPDEDNDGDGIPDGFDSCPNEPEDKDGDRDDDGCPEEDRAPDADYDGIPDDVDECPDEPEDTDGIQDDDGCPEDDADGDGVIDIEDSCPEEPGDAANQGCPPDAE